MKYRTPRMRRSATPASTSNSTHLPVVVPGTGRSRASWEAASDRWFLGGEDREVGVAADGPAAWPRRRNASAALPRRQAPATTVSDVRIVHDKASFRVSRTGVPVLVKVSYFPNWKAPAPRARGG